MNIDQDLKPSDGKEIINSDGSVISGNVLSEKKSENQESQQTKNYSISKDNIPSFKKILVADDGKDISNKAINYSVYLANSTGSELLILRILEDVEMLQDVYIEGSSNTKDTETTDQKFKRSIKGEIIDSMEEKIKKCQEAGCKNRISYKFLASNNAVDEIVTEIKNNNYDLVVLATSHIDSWFKSLFSDARKIISNISKSVLVVQ
ncbi:MAG TPA: universal stress protein [Nitrososphaeraceae archaeon]|nr:universal stress protein [Nitrososphaeraceae archaeon]